MWVSARVGNAVDHMIRAKQRGVDYFAVNTDAQVLEDSLPEGGSRSESN